MDTSWFKKMAAHPQASKVSAVVLIAELGAAGVIGYRKFRADKGAAVKVVPYSPEIHEDPNQYTLDFSNHPEGDTTPVEGGEVLYFAPREEVFPPVVLTEEQAEEMGVTAADPKGLADEVDELELPEEIVNVFAANTPGEFSYEDEAENRRGESPYIITLEEFHGNESGFRQQALTWYEGDRIMADEDDRPMLGWRDYVGEENFRWGYGSGGEDLVFVRNPKLEAEYEITRVYESFAMVMEGLEAEEAIEEEVLRHSYTPRRMRREE